MKLKLTNLTYDRLKWIQRYLLPAAGTLYFALSGIWGLPYGEETLGTFAAFTTFLGVILGLSDVAYNKAHTNVQTEVGGELLTTHEADGVRTVEVIFNANSDAEVGDILKQGYVTLKVDDQ